MTKTTLTTLCCALGFTVMLTGCTDDPVEPTKTYGNLSGLVQADLDENASGLEVAPAGTVVTATVNPSEYTNNPDFGVAYENVQYTATLGPAGKYSFANIETYANPVTVTISFSDFEYDTRNAGGQSNTRHVYTAPDMQVSLAAGQTRVADAVYAY